MNDPNEPINREQIKKLYGIGAIAGMVDSGILEDGLHLMVRRITGKESIKNLTYKEYLRTVFEITKQLKNRNHSEPSSHSLINSGQIKKCWAIMYSIIEIDPGTAKPGERMAGAIKAVLGIETDVNDLFCDVSYGGGYKLIEKLKHYRATAERQARKREKLKCI